MTGLIIATALAAVILGSGMAVLLTVLVRLLWPRRAPSLARLAASVAALDGSDVLAIVCKACNGQPGRCTCAGLCGHKDCAGDHTMTWQMAAELQQLLYGTGEVDELGRPE